MTGKQHYFSHTSSVGGLGKYLYTVGHLKYMSPTDCNLTVGKHIVE